MNVALLEFMQRRVRVRRDISHQEYDVAGINWHTEDLLLLSDNAPFWCHHTKVDLIPENEEE